MAGNSKRRGAMRKDGTKKGMVVGSGGQRRRGLEGKGPTPPAEMRPGAPGCAGARPAAPRPMPSRAVARPTGAGPATARRPETVLGRNPVVECLRAGVPATALHVAVGRAHRRAGHRGRRSSRPTPGISILEVPRNDLDRITGGALHQGVALQVPPYDYAHPDELLETATRLGRARA